MTRKYEMPKAKRAATTVQESIKSQIQAKCNELAGSVLKPTHVQPPPKNSQSNYIIDISTKWHGNYLYFVSTYACPAPNAISPSFEEKFARLEFVGNNRFNLSFQRHTGQWVQLLSSATLEECLESIQNDPWFQP